MKFSNSENDKHSLIDAINTPRVGVSSCLIGHKVRYDGGHKNNTLISDYLNNIAELVPICPEVAIKMGIPRQPIRLVKTAQGIRAQGVHDHLLDVTDNLKNYANSLAPLVATLSGYIFKKGSPSCGAFRVKVYNEDGIPSQNGQGIFSKAIILNYPMMPAEEEGRLNNPQLKENFIKRIFIYHDWQTRLRNGLSVQSLQDFHRIHKFTLLAHDQNRYRQLGKIVAECNKTEIKTTSNNYIREFMEALKNIPTPEQHVNVIMHIMGFFKYDINLRDKAELLQAIHNYRAGDVSREVPLTLIHHHLNNNPRDYLSCQHYLKYAIPII